MKQVSPFQKRVVFCQKTALVAPVPGEFNAASFKHDIVLSSIVYP